MFKFGAVDNLNKTRLQWGTSNKKPVNVFNLNQLCAVFISHTSSINDAAISCLLVNTFQIWANPVVDLINLLCSGCLSRSDGPDRFISQNNIIPVSDFVFNSVKLSFYNFDRLALLSFAQSLTKTENNF